MQNKFAIIGIVVALSLFIGTFALRFATIENDVILTPTEYAVIVDRDGNKSREAYTLEGEFRIEDTFFPFDMSSGTWANKFTQAVSRNKSSLTRTGEYNTTCLVSTMGVRLPIFSMYPLISDVRCTTK